MMPVMFSGVQKRGSGCLTQNGKHEAYTNHDYIKDIPKVSQVEYPRVSPLKHLIPRKGQQPHVKDHLNHRYVGVTPLQHDGVVQNQEGNEEGHLPRFEILGYSQPGIGVCSSSVVVPRLLGRVGRDFIPENNLAVPETSDDLLNDVLAEEALGVGDDGDLKGIEILEHSCPIVFPRAWIFQDSRRTQRQFWDNVLHFSSPRGTPQTEADTNWAG